MQNISAQFHKSTSLSLMIRLNMLRCPISTVKKESAACLNYQTSPRIWAIPIPTLSFSQSPFHSQSVPTCFCLLSITSAFFNSVCILFLISVSSFYFHYLRASCISLFCFLALCILFLISLFTRLPSLLLSLTPHFHFTFAFHVRLLAQVHM